MKKPYVANPNNRLDVAVGDVVNKLPADVHIKAASEDTWKDESGKYWIGDSEPKLCFCRILRSQTVMVRVGGGWMELSKYAKFLDAILRTFSSFLLLGSSASISPTCSEWMVC